MKHIIRQSVRRIERFEVEWPPTEINKFLGWLHLMIDEIPPEHRERAHIVFSNYEDDTSVQIYYDRDESAAEKAAREKVEKWRKEEAQRLEKVEYDRLKDKYDR